MKFGSFRSKLAKIQEIPAERLFDVLLGGRRGKRGLKIFVTDVALQELNKVSEFCSITRNELLTYLVEDYLESLGVLHPADRDTFPLDSPTNWNEQYEKIEKALRLSSKARARLARFAAKQAQALPFGQLRTANNPVTRFAFHNPREGVLAGQREFDDRYGKEVRDGR